MRGGIDVFIVHLKKDVQKKFGHQIAYSKDCQILSDEILDKTSRQVSASTLKRFFGIIKSHFNPSKFTLDTLSIYLDFTSWQDFINSFEEEKHEFSEENSWANLKMRTKVVTNHSLKSLKSKIGKHLKEFPLRKFASKKIDSFLDSSKTATAFIAPAGYDKSTLATQIAQKYKANKQDESSDNIVCLVDGGILFNLISHNDEIDRLTNLLEYNPDKSFANIFWANPDQVKGKFILIIDGLNDLFYKKEKLHAFIDNLIKIILAHSNLEWFKLVVTCRPDDWQSFISVFRNNPIIKKALVRCSIRRKFN